MLGSWAVAKDDSPGSKEMYMVGLTVNFVVLSDRAQLSEIVQQVRDGRLRTNIGNVSPSTTPSSPSIQPSGSTGSDHPRSSVSDTYPYVQHFHQITEETIP